jgi:two-component system LytT family sensor kinase
MLYETEGKLITVDKEIKIIEDYIELEKMRYDHTLKVIFSIETDNAKQEIPPLIMIPLVENAFKHGVSETIGIPFINISLIIQKNTLRFNVENSTGNYDKTVTDNDGIGIKNLRRQLDLMFTEYNLTIENRGSTFYAGMYINLDSYAKN